MTRHNGNNNSHRETPFWVTPRGAKVALRVLYVCAALSILLEIIHPFDADGHGVERIHALDFLASYAIYGFVGCVVLVLLGRVLRRLVMRDENYYGAAERKGGEHD